MKVVPALPFGVRSCSVLHQRTADPEGFVAVPHCRGCGMSQYVSAEAVKIMGDEFGMVPKEKAVSNRFEIHQLEKELAEARGTIRDQELLQAELVEARETIERRNEILATFAELAERGYTPKQIKGLLDRFERFKEDLSEGEDILTEFLSVAQDIAGLSKEKVAA